MFKAILWYDILRQEIWNKSMSYFHNVIFTFIKFSLTKRLKQQNSRRRIVYRRNKIDNTYIFETHTEYQGDDIKNHHSA